jgi:pyrroloquinoline quinone biosynthesis protein E
MILNRKYWYYRRKLLGLLGLPVYSEPLHLDIEPTIRCNLRCRICQVPKWNRTCPDLSLDSFKKILNSAPYLKSIKLQGMGEPLLNKDFFEMVKLARLRDLKVSMHTNGTLLSDLNIQNLIESQINEIAVSCDHYDPLILKNLRPGLNFESFSSGIMQLNKCASEIHVKAYSLLTLDLKENIERHLDFLLVCNFKEIVLQPDITDWGGNYPETSNSALSHEELKEIKERVKEWSEKNDGTTIVFQKSRYSQESPCPWPFHYSYITADLYVQPCCICTNPSIFNLGNLNHRNREFSGIWNRTAYFKFRDIFLNGKLPDFCRSCYAPVKGKP